MLLMKTSACSTGCPKTGERVKNLGALVLLCVGLLLAGSLAAGGTGPDLLTPAERAWLAEHPDIVLGIGEEWAPAVVREAGGRFAGFAFDHLDLLNRKLGTHVRLEAGPWPTVVEKAETGRLAGLTLSAPVEARKTHFLFTQPFHAVQYFIYLRTGQSMPNGDLDGFRGQRVGYLKGILYLRKLLEAHPAVTRPCRWTAQRLWPTLCSRATLTPRWTPTAWNIGA